MPDPLLRRYWDSSVFLDWIKEEPGHAEMCDKIIADAQAGRCIILTSAVTLAEVTKRRRGPLAVEPDTEAKITAFFKNDADFLRVGEQGKEKGYPPIREPEWKGQLSLPEPPPDQPPADQPSN